MNKITDRLSPAPEAVPTQRFRASLKALFRPVALAAALGGSAGCGLYDISDNFVYCPTAKLDLDGEVKEKCGGKNIPDACGHNKKKEGYGTCREKFNACVEEICPDSDSATASIGSSGDIINPTTTSGTVGETTGGTAPGETTGMNTTGSTTMDTTTATTGDMTTGEAPYCGDGNIDEGEQCDNGDGNLPKVYPCDGGAQGEQCNVDCQTVQCPPVQEPEPEPES